MKGRHPIVELLPVLNANKLARGKAFPSVWNQRYILDHVSLTYPWAARFITTYSTVEIIHSDGQEQTIRVHWIRCGFGNQRPTFVCPCSRKATLLYLGCNGLACRKCIGAWYACQSRGQWSRWHLQACKIRAALGGSPTISAPFPKKPKWTHHRTYRKLRSKAEQLERKVSTPHFRRKQPEYRMLNYHAEH